MNYKVAFAETLTRLEQIVNEMISNGYTPCGGITSGSGGVYYYQAMIKTK